MTTPRIGARRQRQTPASSEAKPALSPTVKDADMILHGHGLDGHRFERCRMTAPNAGRRRHAVEPERHVGPSADAFRSRRSGHEGLVR